MTNYIDKYIIKFKTPIDGIIGNIRFRHPNIFKHLIDNSETFYIIVITDITNGFITFHISLFDIWKNHFVNKKYVKTGDDALLSTSVKNVYILNYEKYKSFLDTFDNHTHNLFRRNSN